MKCKLKLFLITVLTTYSVIYSQNINDALNYSSNSYQGTARFNSMSGAFGALGGDLSAIAINPASSAILNDGHFSLSFGSDNKSGEVSISVLEFFEVIIAEHLVLVFFFSLGLQFPQLLVAVGTPIELPQPKIVNFKVI